MVQWSGVKVGRIEMEMTQYVHALYTPLGQVYGVQVLYSSELVAVVVAVVVTGSYLHYLEATL